MVVGCSVRGSGDGGVQTEAGRARREHTREGSEGYTPGRGQEGIHQGGVRRVYTREG